MNPPSPVQSALRRVMARHDLAPDEARAAMVAIMEGAGSPAQVGALLVALQMKGEAAAEVAAFARVMREKAIRIQPARTDLLDTCGTGGDALDTFNISTAAAFVAAGAGLGVAKHGNRAVSSPCGSADVLEALGVRLDLPPETIAACIDEAGIGFLFAPAHHPAMKHVAPVRKEIGVRSVFNILGPLTNPAGARRQLLGVFQPELTDLLATVLAELGTEHALVVHGLDGLDELSTIGPSRVSEVRDGAVETREVTPEEFGLARARQAEIACGRTPAENAALLRAVLDGEAGPRREVVLLNAGAALYVGGKAGSIPDGIALARQSIDSGAARRALDALVERTQGQER